MKISKICQKFKEKIRLAMCVFFLHMNKIIVFADTKGKSTETSGTGSIGDTKLVTGTIKLLNDSSSALLLISPILGGLLSVYFFVRKNAADESDQKQWDKRIKITLVCIIGAVVASGVIKTVTGYYK